MEGDYVNGITVGTVLGCLAAILLIHFTRVNVSDAELYRFCMQQNIKLENCKIMPKEQSK